jgi:membrane associated rhomboid family serine protease
MADFTQFHTKLQLIFWPYLRLALLFLVGYGLADSALLAWAPTFEPPEELRKLLVPSLVAAVVTMLALWPRIRLLADNGKQNDPRWMMAMVAIAVMGCGASCLHGYLYAALNRQAVFASPRAVPAHQPPGAYYQFGHTVQTVRYAGAEAEFGTADKGRKFVFTLYVAVPLLASPADTLRPARVWQGLRYTGNIEASASPAEKEAAYQAFARRTQEQLTQEKFLVPFGYYERLPNTTARRAYVKAARRTGLCPPDTLQPLLVLQPATEPFATHGRSAGYWLLGWLGGGSLLFFGLLLLPYLSGTAAAEFRAGQYERLGWLSWLRPQAGFWLTPLLVVGNVLVYLAMALSTQTGLDSFAVATLLGWGANFGPAVAHGQWWRLLSSTFLHGGLFHLLNNMASLWLMGSLLERPMGTGRLALLYLAAGVGGSLASLAWHPATVGVGASGAIFGLMGAALVLAWRRALPESLRGVVLLLAAFSGGFSLLMGFIMPGIDNAAHLGGLLTGAGLGLLFSPALRRRLPFYEMQENHPHDTAS